MGETTNKIAGKTKKEIGKATGNRTLQAKGAIQEAVGQLQGEAKRLGRSMKEAVKAREVGPSRRGHRPSRR